jgi:hypothetical protein
MSAYSVNGFIDKGFAEPPAFREAQGGETLHRVFGGSSGIVGSFFSLDDPANVSSAEFNANIVKWGNLCLYVARFQVRAGTPMYVGRIAQDHAAPGAWEGEDLFVGGNRNSLQVWIELRRVLTSLTLIGKPHTLLQDRTVVLREGHC